MNVWCGFCFHGKVPLVRTTGSFDNEKYKIIFDNHILFYAAHVWGNIKNFTLQEDNCGPHKVKKIKQYLNEKEVKRMFWPPQSPDLNPIEKICAFLKCEYHKSRGSRRTRTSYFNGFLTYGTKFLRATLKTSYDR